MFYLTKREWDVANLIKEGLTNNQIGKRLYISESTVKTVLEKIYAKLDIHNRVCLAVYICQNEQYLKSISKD